MKLLNRLEKNSAFWFLLFFSILFVVLRFPSLFEPYWYGDEGVYQAVGMLVNSGEKLYIGAWDNKPPLLLAFYALFNSDQFIIRFISLIFGLVSIWFFYFVAKKLFEPNKHAPLISTFIYSFLFGTIILEGNIANAENFMLLPILISAFLILYEEKIRKSLRFKNIFLAGFSLGISFLIKIVAVFDFLAFAFFSFLNPEKRLIENLKSKVFSLTIGFLIPVLITASYFLLTNNIKDFSDALLFKNISYVGRDNEFFIPQGLLILKSIILALFLLILFWKRKKINKNVLFILSWFAFGLFSAFFSHRPYTHYLIMLLPSFSLMIGAVFAYKKERSFVLVLLILSVFIINNSFKLDKEKELGKYYENYFQYITGKKDVSSYQAFFDGGTPRDYALSSYIKENTNDDEKVFVWGNNAQVYKLAGKTPLLRYTVAYHITGFPEGINDMINALEKNKPKFIIIMPNANEPFPLSLTGYNERMDIQGAIIYEKIL